LAGIVAAIISSAGGGASLTNCFTASAKVVTTSSALELRMFKGCLLLALCVLGFCGAYYFAFYVIEHYIDPGYRFSGLIAFCQYLLRKKPND
jgi:hypothetical protein